MRWSAAELCGTGCGKICCCSVDRFSAITIQNEETRPLVRWSCWEIHNLKVKNVTTIQSTGRDWEHSKKRGAPVAAPSMTGHSANHRISNSMS